MNNIDVLLLPKNLMTDLRSYLPFSQTLQAYLLQERFSAVNGLIETFRFYPYHKFFITEILKQTFPYRDSLPSWDKAYASARDILEINEIVEFSN